MLLSLIIISLALLWLGTESKWLTVRLQQYDSRVLINIGGLISTAIALVFMVNEWGEDNE